jgi:protein associated with RNAse G/E
LQLQPCHSNNKLVTSACTGDYQTYRFVIRHHSLVLVVAKDYFPVNAMLRELGISLRLGLFLIYM